MPDTLPGSSLHMVTDRLFAACIGDQSPGAVVAVTHHGREILRAAYGMADIAHGIALDWHSVIRIGSQTKQFTVLLILMLEADGKLSLDDDVRQHLPWLPNYPARVTLRHLATNTSGLREFLEAMAYSGVAIGAPSTREMARQIIAEQADLNFPPGEAMIYCNTGFFLLSEIIEKLSGHSYNEVLAERITGPLGMTDTRLMPRDSEILPRLAMHHTRGPDGAWHRAQWGVVLGGEGGIVSTLADMLVWQANFAHPRIGTPAMFRLLETPSVYRRGTTALYAHGLVAAPYRGLAAISHGGTVAGGKSESMRFPAQELGIVILANRDDLATFSLARRIADAVLGEAMAEAGDPGALIAGTYRQQDGDDVFEITDQDGAVALVSSGGAAAVAQIGPNRFAPERPTTHMVLSPRGDGMDVIWCGEQRHYRRLTADRDASPHPITGCWRHAGLTADITGQGNGHRLLLQSERGTLSLHLAHLDGDLFVARPDPAAPRPGRSWSYTLRAFADSIELSSDRIKGLRFTRAA